MYGVFSRLFLIVWDRVGNYVAIKQAGPGKKMRSDICGICRILSWNLDFLLWDYNEFVRSGGSSLLERRESEAS